MFLFSRFYFPALSTLDLAVDLKTSPFSNKNARGPMRFLRWRFAADVSNKTSEAELGQTT